MEQKYFKIRRRKTNFFSCEVTKNKNKNVDLIILFRGALLQEGFNIVLIFKEFDIFSDINLGLKLDKYRTFPLKLKICKINKCYEVLCFYHSPRKVGLLY